MQDIFDSSMRTWRNIGLSITPKAHIFEDHTIDPMQALNGLSDKTEDFIELYHQDDARQNRRTQVPCRMLMVWVIRRMILSSCTTKMVHVRTDVHKSSETTHE